MSTGAPHGSVISPPLNGPLPAHGVHPYRWNSPGVVRPVNGFTSFSRSAPFNSAVMSSERAVVVADEKRFHADWS